jgi:hypothetical protein
VYLSVGFSSHFILTSLYSNGVVLSKSTI